MHQLIEEFAQVAQDCMRLYFAPLVGAINAVRDEFHRFDHRPVRSSGEKESKLTR